MYSVTVPCYNEEKNLRPLAQRFDPIYAALAREGKELELVLVDNGSVDGTHEVIRELISGRPWVKEVRVPVNQGYGWGILQGLAACTGEYLFWLHADLQLPPEAVVEMIRVLDAEGNPQDMILKGARTNRPLSDRFFTWGMGIFESVYLGAPLRDINAQPTCVPRAFYEEWNTPPHDFSLDLYVYCQAVKRGMRVKRVKVIQQERREGKSSWNTGMGARCKMIRRTLSYSRVLKAQMRRSEESAQEK